MRLSPFTVEPVANAADPAVNNEVFAGIADSWRDTGFPVESFEFPAELNVPMTSWTPVSQTLRLNWSIQR